MVEIRRDGQIPGRVQRLEPVKGRRWDVLAANRAVRELFAAPGENLVRWMFTTDQARETYLEWEPEARAMLGRFRLAAARHPDDPDFEALIAELNRDSQHIRDWWPRHDVTAIGSGGKKLRHPRLGPVDYSHVVLQVADHPDQTLITYAPRSDAAVEPSALGLTLLRASSSMAGKVSGYLASRYVTSPTIFRSSSALTRDMRSSAAASDSAMRYGNAAAGVRTAIPGHYPARAGGPWLCSTLVRSLFHADVVPSGFNTRVQPHRWITT